MSHEILVKKLEYRFGVTGPLLDWIKDYRSGRMQFTVLDGVKSDILPVTTGIPQGSLLSPTLFTLFTNDLPTAISEGDLYMYADDTSIYCIGENADVARDQGIMLENLNSMQLPPQLCTAETLILYMIDFYSRLMCKYVCFILLLYFI